MADPVRGGEPVTKKARKERTTLELVEAMARRGDTWEDIADILGIRTATMSRRGYVHAIQRGHAKYRGRIRKSLNRLLADGNAQVAIHFARSVLGQHYRDSRTDDVPDASGVTDIAELKRDIFRRLARIEAAEQKLLAAAPQTDDEPDECDAD